ncbi:MAG TPA: hypothetical protein VGQ17_05970 [Gemmatimonadales bacterium]|jgi:hypothetical protein|nr:hypothetical protein [Gemmatimonadales bacterium]
MDIRPWILLGFGVGAAAGFLLGELFGTEGHRRAGRAIAGVWRGLRHRRPSRSEEAARVMAALRQVPELAGRDFELLSIGQGGFELHGWVATRGERARAYRLAVAASPGDRIVNCLLVRGEDDVAPALVLDDAPRSA